MNQKEEHISLYQSFEEELQKKECLLSISKCESKTSAFGMNIIQKTNSIVLFQHHHVFSECHSFSPFYSFKRTAMQTKDEIFIMNDDSKESYSLDEYIKKYGALLNQTIDFRRILLPVHIHFDSVQSSRREENTLHFQLNEKGTKDYQQEIKINGDFDSIDFKSCEVNVDLIKKEAILQSQYKVRNGFLNFKIEEKNTYTFSSNIPNMEFEEGFLDFDSYFKK